MTPHPAPQSLAPMSTRRLILRDWRDDDLEPFAEMNADPRVMRLFPATLDRAASDRLAGLIRAHIEAHGFGLWAVEVRGGTPFIGFVGLSHVHFDAPFTPAIEIGWRLAAEHHGQGYATEAARAALEAAFTALGLERVVSFTTPDNRASSRVMEKIGMRHLGHFDHPRVPPESPLCTHSLFEITRGAWIAHRRPL